MARRELGNTLSTLGQVLAYILAAVLLIQLLRAIFGGTWKIEDIILAMVVFNLTITFGIGGYSETHRISGTKTLRVLSISSALIIK